MACRGRSPGPNTKNDEPGSSALSDWLRREGGWGHCATRTALEKKGLSQLRIDIRKIAAQNFARDAREPITETTPAEITPDVIAFCEGIGAAAPVLVSVQQDPLGMYGMCFIGAADKIKAGGGSISHGWAIWETLPRLFLTAEFHAVWVSPADELIDITPKPQREARIVFAPDPRYPADFDFLKRPNSHRVRIYRPTDPMERARERIGQFNNANTNMSLGVRPEHVCP